MPVVRPKPMSVSCPAVVTGIEVVFLSCSNPCDIHVAEAGVNKKSTSCDVLSL